MYVLVLWCFPLQVAGGRVVTALNCSVTADDVELRCLSPPGVGREYQWTVSVAGQPSLPLTLLTSYEAPVVTGVAVVGTY
jgi:hypothetical protein